MRKQNSVTPRYVKRREVYPLPERLNIMNRVAVVVSCVCAVGLVALLAFGYLRGRNTSYTDYTPPAGLRFANERPAGKSSSGLTDQDKARPIRDDRRQFVSSAKQAYPIWVPGQPKPRMVFQGAQDEVGSPAHRLPVANSSPTPLSKGAENTRLEPGAGSPEQKPTQPNPELRLFRTPSPRMAVASDPKP